MISQPQEGPSVTLRRNGADQTDYASVEHPASLFHAGAQYDGAEVRRRLARWVAAQPTPEVLVEIEGGVLAGVYSPAPVTVTLLDHDNWACCNGSAEGCEYEDSHDAEERADYRDMVARTKVTPARF